MKLTYDRHQIASARKYDERNLQYSQSGKHKYPSKKMFVEFLKQFKDVDAEASIWGMEDLDRGVVTINVEVVYKPVPYCKHELKKAKENDGKIKRRK